MSEACGAAEPTAVAGGKDYLRSAASLVGQLQQSPTANSETFTSPPVVGWQEAEVNVVNQKSLADHNFAPFNVPLHADEHAVAFLSRYPTLLGYTIVAPRAHVVDVTGDRQLFRRVTNVVHDVAEALKAVVLTERIYLMSLGSHQGNAHVHWHVAPLPPGIGGRSEADHGHPRGVMICHSADKP